MLDSNNYNEAELVEVKIPLRLPYYNNNISYERVDGQIKFNGLQYNYVKRKIANDTLYILCLANYNKTNLYGAKNEFAKNAGNTPVNQKTEGSSIKKSPFAGDCNFSVSTIFLEDCFCQCAEKPIYHCSTFKTVYKLIPHQPPQV